MKKQHQPLYSKPNYYHTAMNYPLALYMTQTFSLFLPPAMWDLTPVSDDMQGSFVVRCFSPILWFYLQIIQFQCQEKRGGRPWSNGGRIVMVLKSFSEKRIHVCVFLYVLTSVLEMRQSKCLKTWLQISSGHYRHIHWITQIKVPLRQHTAIVEEMGITCTWTPTDSTYTNTRWPQCGIYTIRKHMSRNYFEPTQDTTRPLKQGSFALSSDISSFTTL